MQLPATIDLQRFEEGQQAFARGLGIRQLLESNKWMTDAQREQLVLGYFDGAFAAIRRIDNQMVSSSPSALVARGPM